MKPLEEMGKFATVVVDPPWDIAFGGKDADDNHRRREVAIKNGKPRTKPDRSGGYSAGGYTGLPYVSMSLDEIQRLPIPVLLTDPALVFLWTTQAMLPFAFGVVDGWGLAYAYTMTWHKPSGPKPLTRPMYNSEFIVVGQRSVPMYLDHKAFVTANYWRDKGHSEKPEGFYDLLRRVTPGPRLDIFGRRKIAGFTSWGNEAPEGEPDGDHYQQVLLDT